MSQSAAKWPAARAVDVILRDGRTLRLRRPGRETPEASSTSSAGCPSRASTCASTDSPTLGAATRRAVPRARLGGAGALLGTLADDGRRSASSRSRTTCGCATRRSAEVAFAVADAHQRRGIGTRLLEQLAARRGRGRDRALRRRGACRDNRHDARRLRGGRLRARARAPRAARWRCSSRSRRPTSTRARVAERDHGRGHRLAPAVLRAAERRRDRRFQAPRLDRRRALPQHPRRRLHGRRVPGQPRRRAGRGRARLHLGRGAPRDGRPRGDLPFPAPHVLEAAEQALRARGPGARASSRPASPRSGGEGLERQERLLALVRAHGARLIGPNCLGIAVAGPQPERDVRCPLGPAGNIGFSSQSGALGLALLEAAEARGSGLSAFVSIGNKADVSSNDLLEWWEDDAATDVVLMYVESFGNPRRFGRLARRVARRKPILALKSGTSASGRAGGELAHGGAGRLRGCGRCALPPGRRDSRGLARGAASTLPRCFRLSPSREDGMSRF